MVFACILMGAALSWWISDIQRIALASAVAFLVSELADFAIYTPLEKHGWLRAVLLSNIVGLVLDSYVFLTIASGSLAFFWGQVVGKLWVTLIAVAFLKCGNALFRGKR